VRISIDGWKELREEVGDERALEMLREIARRLPELAERDIRTGGRVYTEWDVDTREESVQIRPQEDSRE
jgi:hypothetical protein